jgi:hypothetical protein
VVSKGFLNLRLVVAVAGRAQKNFRRVVGLSRGLRFQQQKEIIL